MLDVFLAGLVAEWVRKIVLAPIDTLTVRLQVQRGSRDRRSRNPFVEDAIALARELHRPVGLYNGLGVGLIGAIPQALVYMPTFELSSAMLRDSRAPAQLASVFTGIICSVVRVPTTVVKTRLQCGAASARQTVAEALASGWIGLYASWRASCVLDVVYALVQFSALERFRSIGSLSGAGTILTDGLVGLLTGVVTAVVTEPLDVVTTRMRVQRYLAHEKRHIGRDARAYSGLVDGLQTVVREEGVLSLWRGLLPRLVLKAAGSLIWYPVYIHARRVISAMIEGGWHGR
mmetsp:Transcript_18226/g.59623  ORF Transcript_18226/g.59623 Transcript_18226/m.59623 type:complete len:289 (-) Transcript_18226:164-1030(-)